MSSSSILQQQLSVEKLVKATAYTAAVVLPPSPIQHHAPDATTTNTLQVSAIAPLERCCADPLHMTAQTFTVDSNKADNNVEISNSSIKLEEQQHKCKHQNCNSVEQANPTIDTSNPTVPILLDMHPTPDASKQIAATPERRQSLPAAGGAELEHMYAENSVHNADKLSNSSIPNATQSHDTKIYQLLTSPMHELPADKETTNESDKSAQLTVNSKLKDDTNSTLNITDVKRSAATGNANAQNNDARTNTQALDVLLNGGLSQSMFKHLPPRPSVVALQQHITSTAVEHFAQANLQPPNDCMLPVSSSTFLYEKESQLLAKLFATDLVIPKCYATTTSAVSDAGDAGGHNNKTDNRLTYSNGEMLAVAAKEKPEFDVSVPSTRTAESAKQPQVSNAALNLLTEILLRQQDFQHIQQQTQLHTAAVNNVEIAPALQKDPLHINKLSMASPLSLPFPFQLPLPLSLSLPLPLPLSLPLMPVIDNTKNNNNYNAISKQPTFEVPTFLIGDSTGECKEPIYLNSKHESTAHHEQHQEIVESSQQQQQSTNHLLATQFLYSRLLRANVPALTEQLRERDIHMLDYAPSISKPHSPASCTQSTTNDSNNNRNHLSHVNSATVDTNLAFDKVLSNAYQCMPATDLPTDNSGADKCSRHLITHRHASGTELLSAQETALTQAQLQLDKYLELSQQFVALTQPNVTIKDKLTSHIVPRVREHVAQTKTLIDSTQTQLRLLRRQCATAKLYYERTMRRMDTSAFKYLRQKHATYTPAWCVDNNVTRAAVIAAMAVAIELQPLPATTYVKTERLVSGKSELSDSEFEQPAVDSDTRETLLGIETYIERYVKTVCSNNVDVNEPTTQSNVETLCNADAYDSTIYSANKCGNNAGVDYDVEGGAHVKCGNQELPSFMKPQRPLEASSPICFWHPDNRGLHVNDDTLSAAEIILECAALSVQAHMQGSANATNTMAGENIANTAQAAELEGNNCENNHENAERTPSVDATILTSAGNDAHAAAVIKDDTGEKKAMQLLRLGSPMLNSPTVLTPTSTPTTTPTPPLNTSITNFGKNQRNARHHESTASKLRQRYSNNNGSDVANSNSNTSDINMGKKLETNILETLQVMQTTSEATAAPAVVGANIGSKKKQQQQYTLHQPQQQQVAFSSCSSSNNDNNGASGSGSLYGLHSPAANSNCESTAAAAVVALQERAFTDIFKARFNALTAAAVMNATAAAAAASAPDGPYDLSISRKVKQTNLDSKISTANQQGNECKDNSNEKKKPHIKKPLNAFMLYMKEMRAKVVAECTLKESAAINQILGRRWHALGREEQAKYYELARRERQLHMQMYPDWSSRTNTSRGKKRKRKQDTNDAGGGGNNMKKCRARFGLDQQNQWCKPCRRKKKCIRYMEGLSSNAGSSGTKDDSFQDLDDLEEDNASDDNLGSPGSIDDNNKTPDDDTESLNNSLSSPGCQSGLSSLQSPSTSMASPLNLLASPATPVTVGVPFGLSDNQQEQNVPSQQQQLQQASSEQQMRMQHHHHQQQQMHLSQHQQLMQHHHPHPTHTNNSIYEQHAKGARPFLCNSGSGVGVGRSTLMSPALSNNGASGICIGSNNSLTNTSTTPSAVAAAAAFTERTMRSLLNPSPSGLLLNNNCFPQSTLEPSGAIVSIEQILANSNSLSTSTATTTPTSAVAKYPTTTNTNSTLSNRATDESNSFITYSSNSNASFTNSNTNNNGVCEPNAMQAVTSTQPILSAVVKTKSSVSSSASSEPSSPACDTYEKSVPPAQRNPIGANPHDINNPLSINQLTKCSESTSSNNNISCTVTKNSDNNADPSSLDNVPTAFNSLTNGIAAKQYKHSPQQLQKQLALRIPTIAATPQHQSLLPPVPQHYQQQFNLHAGTGPPTPSTHHHAHHHAHSPLFNQHFQQFSHHLASVAAAAAAASIHMPNILSAAAAVNPNNNSIQRNSRSGATTHEAVDAVATTAATTIAASETTLNNETGTESSANMPAAKCHATQSTTAVTTPTAKTLPVLATDSAAIANVSTSKTGSENGAISVT
ncbi:uncharacterized protein LOC105218274 isoform X2 [Zeugodacus cucurbitae]|uniref:uncharacterized protein LOC105218274 isoform X2 n=1 Tax=Zeugodacus cucurbitae TaxID=28588 RepID=UPI0010A74F8A|nr:uncharacterized protein LOC105218274 isoform X2 [Zeugodacus cucurbitae]